MRTAAVWFAFLSPLLAAELTAQSQRPPAGEEPPIGDSSPVGHWVGPLPLPIGPVPLELDIFLAEGGGLRADLTFGGSPDVAMAARREADGALRVWSPIYENFVTLRGRVSADGRTWEGRAVLLAGEFPVRLERASTEPRPPAPRPPAPAFPARPNDNRTPAGASKDGRLALRLVAREAAWRPRGADGPALAVFAFAEEGAEAASVPAPLIRAPAGTEVSIALRNDLPHRLVVFGLHDHPAPAGQDSVSLAPGESRELRFEARAEGTYPYWAHTRPPRSPFMDGRLPDGTLVGALVVDPVGPAPPPEDRILLVSRWVGWEDPSSVVGARKFSVNGASWPYTERIEATAGDTLRWRVVNASPVPHPMHLHGFYFRVDARGTAEADTLYAPEERRLAVTETLDPGATMAMAWAPEEPGNWLFHCHLLSHMAGTQRIALHGEAPADTAFHAHMAGLITGITVHPAAGHEARDPSPARTLRLYAGARPGAFGDEPALGFSLQEGTAPPAPDSLVIPGPTLELTRGETTRIVVANRLSRPLAVHWHGLELPSRYDGVADWSGRPGRTVPAIAPGDSFAVELRPPRAGTFIYHVHSERGHELSQGLYGPLLVLEPGRSRDAATDRVVLLSDGGPRRTDPPAVNGKTAPEPMTLAAGRLHRLRFINISADGLKTVELREGDRPASWTVVAKDGADLLPSRRRAEAASLRLLPGETVDVALDPGGPRGLVLSVATTYLGTRPPHALEIPVEVRPAP